MDIAFWGGVASVITFAVMLVSGFFKGYKWINEKIAEREKFYAEIRDEVHLLTSKATTQGKRQDLFIIINGKLNNGRNRESILRWAISTSIIMSMISIDIAITVMSYLVKLGPFYWFVLAETIVFILGAYSGESGHPFRSKPATYSGANRPPCGEAVACWTGAILRGCF